MWDGSSVPTKDKSNPQGLDMFSFANIFSKKETTTLGFERTSVKIAEAPPPHSNGPWVANLKPQTIYESRIAIKWMIPKSWWNERLFHQTLPQKNWQISRFQDMVNKTSLGPIHPKRWFLTSREFGTRFAHLPSANSYLLQSRPRVKVINAVLAIWHKWAPDACKHCYDLSKNHADHENAQCCPACSWTKIKVNGTCTVHVLFVPSPPRVTDRRFRFVLDVHTNFYLTHL